MSQKFTKKEIEFFRHALEHVKENHIHMPKGNAWYYGSKRAFLRRHRLTMKFLETLINESDSIVKTKENKCQQ